MSLQGPPIELRIIVALNKSNGGIGIEGKLPWTLKKDLKMFRERTLNNPVIMGKKTWESIPSAFRPLPKRLNVVLSHNPAEFQRHYLESRAENDCETSDTQVICCGCLESAINLLKLRDFKVAYIIGGAQVYKEAISHPYCTKICVTSVEQDISCDRFFPTIPNSFKLESSSDIYEENGIQFCFLEYSREYSKSYDNSEKVDKRQVSIKSSLLHEEYQYLELVQTVMEHGIFKNDRTGIGTLSIFGHQMRFNLRHHFPLLTTKKVFWKGVVHELLWFIRGSTNAKELGEKNVHIWDGNASRAFLNQIGLYDREEGDLGPIYGFQWRHFGAKYRTMHDKYQNEGVDQLADIVESLKKNPNSRRMILTAWNPSAIPEMALPPCHVLCQFYVSDGYLSCHMYQRSCDMGLGVPFNIASYALLTYIMAKIVNMSPGDLIYSMGDVHIYSNHIGPLMIQLNRKPRTFPRLRIKERPGLETVDDFTFSDFELIGYHPHDTIKMEMAV
eukprot:jgi/Galph1/6084/GphlegSOOS_G4688.1